MLIEQLINNVLCALLNKFKCMNCVWWLKPCDVLTPPGCVQHGEHESMSLFQDLDSAGDDSNRSDEESAAEKESMQVRYNTRRSSLTWDC